MLVWPAPDLQSPLLPEPHCAPLCPDLPLFIHCLKAKHSVPFIRVKFHSISQLTSEDISNCSICHKKCVSATIFTLWGCTVHMEYFCLNPFKILVTLRLPNGSANSWETQCCKERGRKVLQRGGGWCCDRLWLIYEPHYTLHSDPATARATLCICPIFLQYFRLPLGGVVKASELFCQVRCLFTCILWIDWRPSISDVRAFFSNVFFILQ